MFARNADRLLLCMIIRYPSTLPDCHGTIFHCYEVQNKSQYETGYTFLPDYHN